MHERRIPRTTDAHHYNTYDTRAWGVPIKRSAWGCTKLRRLANCLRVPQYAAVGILESVWHWTARECPAGDIGKLDDQDIADGIDYRGDSGKLVGALKDSGWLDQHPTHRLIVHDWHEHCDNAVKKYVSRAKIRFASECDTSSDRSGPWIYFVQGADSKRIKIGFTEGSIHYRIKALQTGSAERLELLTFSEGTRAEEISLHKQLAAHSVGGEWFESSEEVLAVVRQRRTSADNGRPPEPEPLPLPEPMPEPEKSESKSLEDEVVIRSQPEYLRDETFAPLKVAFEHTGAALIESDWIEAHYEWRVLDFEQKAGALVGVKRLMGKDPNFIPKPKNYLKRREWTREQAKRAQTETVLPFWEPPTQ